MLGNETYGVDILRVQEIRGFTAVTKIPHAPSHVLGVLNLRGSIVPIVDLRMRFSLERAEYNAVTVIIVLSVQSANGRRDFGVVVDGVSDVVDVNKAEVRPAPELGSASRHRVHPRPRAGRRAHGGAARHRLPDRQRPARAGPADDQLDHAAA